MSIWESTGVRIVSILVYLSYLYIRLLGRVRVRVRVMVSAGPILV